MASAVQKKLKVSPELAELSGQTELTRGEATKALWDYIKANNLKNPANGKEVFPDAKLAKILGSEPIHMLKFAGKLKDHFIK